MRCSTPTAPRSSVLAALMAGWAVALSGCTSTQEVLEPSALVDAGAANPASQEPQATIPGQVRVHFTPVIGAPEQVSAPLGARLAARARERGINLAENGDSAATHIVRGYFSTISEGSETTVIYVWDVTDPGGTRVHRIQGQVRSGTAGGGWATVDAPTMEAIADQTVDQLAGWLVSSQG